jgi:hypothetical protein
MGASVSCPVGFEPGLFGSCHMRCPDDFKYVYESGGVGVPVEKCVSRLNNDFVIGLTPLPAPVNATPEEPEAFKDERKRFLDELAMVRMRIDEFHAKEKDLEELVDQKRRYVNEYGKIESEFAAYTNVAAANEKIKEVSDTLKPFRPPTAPSSDIEKERRAIQYELRRNFLVIQLALFIVVLCLLVYLFVSIKYAHYIAFLLVCVGIALGIFLRK